MSEVQYLFAGGHVKLTRRTVVAGLGAVAACGSYPEEFDDGLAASGPEDDEMPASVIPAKYTPSQSFPLHLTASTNLAANSSGGVNAISLKSPSGEAMEILEVRFSITAVPTVSSTLSPAYSTYGAVIACKLDLGKYPLTNGYVPVALFGRSEELMAEQITDVGSSNLFNAVCNEYAWRPPHPIYVPKGAVLVPTFQHRGITPFDLNVRISYAARLIPDGTPAPKRVMLPYVAAWGSGTFDAAVTGTDRSTETDLVNPFKEPLYIQRMVGRVINVFVATNRVDEGITTPTETVPALLWNVRIVDSHGHPVVQKFTPFRLVFSSVTRSWDMDPSVTLAPMSFYSAYVRKDVLGGYPALNSLNTQAFISIVGWRDVVGEKS
jgi:hypothetical protein